MARQSAAGEKRAYFIRLADESRWLLQAADPAAEEMVRRYASALGLSAAVVSSDKELQSAHSLFIRSEWATGLSEPDSIHRPSHASELGDLFLAMRKIQHQFSRSLLEVNRAVLLHGALVCPPGVPQVGVILSARRGVGKTTACRRLPPDWEALADETVLVVRDAQGTFWGHPFPTLSRFANGGSGGVWQTERAVPLAAAFFLKQAPEDRLEPIGQGQAAALLTCAAEQISYWLTELPLDTVRILRQKRFDQLCRLAQSVPAFVLHLTLTGRFWELIEQALDEKVVRDR
ncbi:MAG: SynChlorMet cassette protein ScmC [candidate division KSB1 bacterium]|nr:SynChlorMet cassette protein ScmC [candidate division KSB1 bacterium]